MINIYSEIGIGNSSLVSTEFEDGDREYRTPRFIIPTNISGLYVRLWIGRNVYILSSNHGFEITHKERKRFKAIFGISGEGKTLKFTSELVDRILSGEKFSTWRLFDDKDLKIGNKLIFINKENGQAFGRAKIIKLVTKAFGALTDEDWVGHEKFSSEVEMYDTYSKYYGKSIGSDTEIKIMTFDFEKI